VKLNTRSIPDAGERPTEVRLRAQVVGEFKKNVMVAQVSEPAEN
jgi:hypothetical protein